MFNHTSNTSSTGTRQPGKATQKLEGVVKMKTTSRANTAGMRTIPRIVAFTLALIMMMALIPAVNAWAAEGLTKVERPVVLEREVIGKAEFLRDSNANLWIPNIELLRAIFPESTDFSVLDSLGEAPWEISSAVNLLGYQVTLRMGSRSASVYFDKLEVNAQNLSWVEIPDNLPLLTYTPTQPPVTTTPPPTTDDITVIIGGTTVNFPDQKPVIVDGRTLGPVAPITAAVGGEASWNGDTRTATIVVGTTTLVITIGSHTMLVNGTEVELDVPAQIINGRTMLPFRPIGEALGYDDIGWDGNTRTVTMTK
jgi:hypothetical protein